MKTFKDFMVTFTGALLVVAVIILPELVISILDK